MLGEVRWDLAWGEHAFDGGWQERPTDERRDRVAQDVSEDGDRGRRGQRYVGARSRLEIARQQYQAAHRLGMIEREGSGNHGAQQVTEDEGPLDSQTIESASQKVGLRSRRPLSTVRTVAVAHTRPVERDDPMTFGREVENATVRKILGGDDVAVQQDDGRPFTLFEVMEPDAVKVDEPTLGRVPPLHPRASYVETAVAVPRQRRRG